MAEKKGLTIIHTGAGKGKTTAALGLALRAAGNGLQVIIRQFIKGEWRPGEMTAMEKFTSNIDMKAVGKGFIRPDRLTPEERERAVQEIHETFASVCNEVFTSQADMVILDEVIYLLKFGLIGEDELLEMIARKPVGMHLVLTGRGATEKLIDVADMVTEMTSIKHPFDAGIKAQLGIEF